MDSSVWGVVPRNPTQVTNSFSNDPRDRPYQDVGFDGLTDSAEASYRKNDYLNVLAANFGVNSKIYQDALADPSADNYQYYRGNNLDAENAGILARYKKYNNPQGNSPIADNNAQFSSAATMYPDQEDANKDNTLNETEEYFQYVVTLKPPSAPKRDSLHLPENSIPPGITVMDTLHHQKDSLLTQPIGDSIQKPKDSTRYFIAYHHVRIFNDSLQSVCDSMFISSADSVFRLYYSPVIWSGKTQVSGDTMFLFTKNKEAERLFVFDKAMVVSQTKEGFFNQMTGKTLNAYFINNQFDHIRLKGSQSESVYYLQDEDSAYIGMQRSVGDVIDMIFQKGELEKVKVINQVKGMIYPMNQIPEDQRQLKGFEWLDKRRPKNKAELFE